MLSRSYLAFSVLFSRLGSPRHWQGSRGFSVVVVVVVVLVVVGAGVGAAPVSVALLPTWIIRTLQKPKDYTNLLKLTSVWLVAAAAPEEKQNLIIVLFPTLYVHLPQEFPLRSQVLLL